MRRSCVRSSRPSVASPNRQKNSCARRPRSASTSSKWSATPNALSAKPKSTMIDRLRAALADLDYSKRVGKASEASIERALPAWRARDEQGFSVFAKVRRAFAKADLHDGHLAGTTGYGYHDRGR